jgi:hypothetical protein
LFIDASFNQSCLDEFSEVLPGRRAPPRWSAERGAVKERA